MAQLRLKNSSGRTSIIGQQVKLSPTSSSCYVTASLGDSGIIGTVAEFTPNGNSGLINLINTTTVNNIIGMSVRETAPPNPKVGDLWFW